MPADPRPERIGAAHEGRVTVDHPNRIPGIEPEDMPDDVRRLLGVTVSRVAGRRGRRRRAAPHEAAAHPDRDGAPPDVPPPVHRVGDGARAAGAPHAARAGDPRAARRVALPVGVRVGPPRGVRARRRDDGGRHRPRRRRSGRARVVGVGAGAPPRGRRAHVAGVRRQRRDLGGAPRALRRPRASPRSRSSSASTRCCRCSRTAWVWCSNPTTSHSPSTASGAVDGRSRRTD